MLRSWDNFIRLIYEEKAHSPKERLKALKLANHLFRKETHFKNLTLDERNFIAGTPNKLNKEGSDLWGLFGSMQGSGYFKEAIGLNNELIPKALDQIPLTGQITKQHYDNYIRYFKEALPQRMFLASATRLLAMKRPDVFICVAGKNMKALCKDFKIVQSGMNYERYWTDIIERIFDSNWWQNPTPKSHEEEGIDHARAAFLDSMYYQP